MKWNETRKIHVNKKGQSQCLPPIDAFCYKMKAISQPWWQHIQFIRFIFLFFLPSFFVHFLLLYPRLISTKGNFLHKIHPHKAFGHSYYINLSVISLLAIRGANLVSVFVFAHFVFYCNKDENSKKKYKIKYYCNFGAAIQ